jgi:hypothetical protein
METVHWLRGGQFTIERLRCHHGEHIVADCAVKSGKLRICTSDTSTSLARQRFQSYVELFSEIREYRDRSSHHYFP